MGRQLSPRYGHVICETLTQARKCEIIHWFPCGAYVRPRDYENFSDG